VNDPKNLCDCKLYDLTGQGIDPLYVPSREHVLAKHTRGRCQFGSDVANEVVAELGVLRAAMRGQRPSPEQMRIESMGSHPSGPVEGMTRVPYEAFRAMLIDMSPTLSYVVNGVVLEMDSRTGTTFRLKADAVEVATYQCEGCENSMTSAYFDAVVPARYGTNQDVPCPKCHSSNDVVRT
jgi:hypothetical protein